MSVQTHGRTGTHVHVLAHTDAPTLGGGQGDRRTQITELSGGA